MRPSQTLSVLETLRDSFSGPLHREGVELSLDDSQTVRDVYQQLVLLMVDLGYLHHETLKRNAHRLLSDWNEADVLFLNNTFAELLNRVRLKNFKGFKALCRPVSSHLYPLIKTDCDDASHGDAAAAGRLIQLFSYTSRLSLNDIDLTQQCLDDYLETERNILPVEGGYIIDSINEILIEWMKPFDSSRLSFGHGPGGVAGHGRTTLDNKYKDLTFDELTSYAFGFPWWCAGYFEGRPIKSSLDRISQTIFVPKSYKTFRTISMESSTLQYLQQGVWSEIDRLVGRSQYLRGRIGFHEQERNQRLAREGSIARNYATIDLSAASDSVSYDLVLKAFRKTKVLRYLVATRSKRTLLPDGRIVALKKFAPMGSALCFPVETLIFAAICELVTREHRVAGDYSVFGDDIIVPTQCVSRVMFVLEFLGFKVNKSKSFYQSDIWFRESCGAEYCDGVDVTPMRVSRKYAHRQDDVRLGQLIDLANTAYTRGYKNLRAFFLKKLREMRYTALFSPTSVLSDNYTNYHTERRWNSNLQRIDAKVTTLKSKTVTNEESENLRLRHWFESTQGRLSIGDGYQSVIAASTVSTRNRWMEKPYESLDQDFIDYFVHREDN
jgi:hypothetical protein